ncbi:MAG: peptidoglycan glycosyltransferase [Clostridia bacterium]|nr:peptidoglycan glycosyltransferase [Clostridia bacterium]
MRNKTAYRKKIVIYVASVVMILILLAVRFCYIMIGQADYYTKEAQELHERERKIKAARGRIYDRNGELLASNKTVCTISVIHSQIKDEKAVVDQLSKMLSIPRETVEKRVRKVTSIEKIKSNVDKKTGDEIRNLNLSGVKVDEDFKRYYPYGNMASKVLGFTGGDNQGIIGLEVIYDEILQGKNGRILTMTDARGIELNGAGENRIEPIEGNDLYISIDLNIQKYAQQIAEKAMEKKQATRVEAIVMNPQNGEIYAMVNVPEFDCNQPYDLSPAVSENEIPFLDAKMKQDALNQIWRNACINDTYEPGSTFKIITAAAAFENGELRIDDTFHCPGFIAVENRRIRCSRIQGHGSQDFTQATMNSCNPAFVSIGMRVGSERLYQYLKQTGVLEKTGIDLPGEANTIMHVKDDIGPVELATISFGQSFQVTPLRLATSIGETVNGGHKIKPHLALYAKDADHRIIADFKEEKQRQMISKETSDTLTQILEQVVANGTGKNAYIEGYSIGGKTATSQTLPRSSAKYIASFVGFSPAKDPQILAIYIIHNPSGIYYGGTIAAPLVKELFSNVLPYLDNCKKKTYTN